MRRGSASLPIILIILIVSALGGAYYLIKKNAQPQNISGPYQQQTQKSTPNQPTTSSTTGVTQQTDKVLDLNNLHWLDDDKYVYTDGEETVRLYSKKNNSTKTILGPEEANGICTDACGYVANFVYSPDYEYLIRMVGGFAPFNIAVVNLKTLRSFEIKESFENTSEPSFSTNNKILSFSGVRMPKPDYSKVVNVEINLETQKVTISD